jgi:hypothetical protein
MFNMSNRWTEFWAVDLSYNPKESRSERDARRKRERAVLAEHGYESKKMRFNFLNTDKQKVKDAAKAKAEKLAAEIEAKTGIKVEVLQGSWL